MPPRSRNRKIAVRRPEKAVPVQAIAVVEAGDRHLAFGNRWEYAPAPETVPVKIRHRYGLFIGGRFVSPAKDRYFDSVNPATEKKLTEIAQADAADVAKAVHA